MMIHFMFKLQSDLPNPSSNKHLFFLVLSLTHDIATLVCANVPMPPTNSHPLAAGNLSESRGRLHTLYSGTILGHQRPRLAPALSTIPKLLRIDLREHNTK